MMRKQTMKSSGGMIWKVLGGAALALAVVGLVVTYPDIKRYVKISTM
ncbi:hypothetical protein [Pyrinomonas sp.]|mgnify:CR=1 FL=1